jgi:dihydrofolate synthase/folylpolyglutamate synthase
LRGAWQLKNASCALAALDEVADRLPVSLGEVKRGLTLVSLPGRLQVLPGKPTIVLDVAHNPHAARSLAEGLGDMGFFENTYAVFAMLADKDIGGVIDAIKGRVDRWYVATPKAREERRQPRLRACWRHGDSKGPRAPSRPSPPPSKQHVVKRGRMIELSFSDRSIPWPKRCGSHAKSHGKLEP